MIGLDDGDAAAIERAGIGLAYYIPGAKMGAVPLTPAPDRHMVGADRHMVTAVALVGWLLAGCAHGPRPETAIEASAYAAELEACAVQSSTCPGYVACRSRVAAAHGRTYTGRCVP